MREIVKQAVTAALFIDEIENDLSYSRYSIPHARLRLAQKVVKGLLRRMKQSKYNTMKDRWGKTYYDNIQHHLELKVNEYRSTAVYLTYVQWQIHSFLRGLKFNAVGRGGYRRNTDKVSYYKATLETLMN